MSTDKEPPTRLNRGTDQDSDRSNDGKRRGKYSTTYSAKVAVLERDRYTCISCREKFDDITHLDVDHNVPEGRGGPNTIRNKSSLCRRCHEATQAQRDHAPTIRCISTGDVCQKDFLLFKQFWTEQLPAMSDIILEHRLKPKFDLSDAPYRAWHVPAGEIRRLDEVLADIDEVTFAPLGTHHYM